MADVTPCMIDDLPVPPVGRTGWPWTEAGTPAPAVMPDGGAWPRISVVTPSFNQSAYLEETIRSILLQGYPGLEYVVVDGGSSDESVSIIQKYEPWIARWVSERDRGQAHAINKGLAWCTGELFNWINSDDLLRPGTLREVATVIAAADTVAGAVINFDVRGAETIIASRSLSFENLVYWTNQCTYHQPGVWLRRRRVEEMGGVDERYHFCFDYLLMLRYLKEFPDVAYTPSVLARFRVHSASKTSTFSWRFVHEMHRICEEMADASNDVPFREACSQFAARRRGQQAWSRYLSWIRQHRGSKSARLAAILRHALRRPRTRASRMTAGAIRRIIEA